MTKPPEVCTNQNCEGYCHAYDGEKETHHGTCNSCKETHAIRKDAVEEWQKKHICALTPDARIIYREAYAQGARDEREKLLAQVGEIIKNKCGCSNCMELKAKFGELGRK